MNAESEQVSGIVLQLPCSEEKLFRYSATAPILNLLSDNVLTAFSIRELHRATGYSIENVSNAIKTLEASGIVSVRTEGNQKRVEINSDRLLNPENPYASIPQQEFRIPVKKACKELKKTLENIKGIVLFGSVATGTADRQSDIDLFVLVEDDQASNQRAAHEVAKSLRNTDIDGERYEYQILVESVGSASNYGDKLRDVMTNCITIKDSEELAELKEEVLKNNE